jgi:hypothetical protein
MRRRTPFMGLLTLAFLIILPLLIGVVLAESSKPAAQTAKSRASSPPAPAAAPAAAPAPAAPAAAPAPEPTAAPTAASAPTAIMPVDKELSGSIERVISGAAYYELLLEEGQIFEIDLNRSSGVASTFSVRNSNGDTILPETGTTNVKLSLKIRESGVHNLEFISQPYQDQWTSVIRLDYRILDQGALVEQPAILIAETFISPLGVGNSIFYKLTTLGDEAWAFVKNDSIGDYLINLTQTASADWEFMGIKKLQIHNRTGDPYDDLVRSGDDLWIAFERAIAKVSAINGAAEGSVDVNGTSQLFDAGPVILFISEDSIFELDKDSMSVFFIQQVPDTSGNCGGGANSVPWIWLSEDMLLCGNQVLKLDGTSILSLAGFGSVGGKRAPSTLQTQNYPHLWSFSWWGGAGVNLETKEIVEINLIDAGCDTSRWSTTGIPPAVYADGKNLWWIGIGGVCQYDHKGILIRQMEFYCCGHGKRVALYPTYYTMNSYGQKWLKSSNDFSGGLVVPEIAHDDEWLWIIEDRWGSLSRIRRN